MNDLTNKTAFVTGATGFLGGALVHRLANEGVTVYALARQMERAHYIQHRDNVHILLGDIIDTDRMHTLMPDCDIVFHVAAALGGTYEMQSRVNVGGTMNVLHAAAAKSVSRFVHVSSIAVYGYTCPTIVTEDTIQRPGNVPYNRTKSEAETAVKQIAAANAFDYSIVRPGMIFGARSHAWTEQFFRLGQLNPTPFVGDGNGTAYPIHVDDVVDMLLTIATHPHAANDAFNCVLDPPPSWREFIGSYSQLAGHSHWLSIPVWLVEGIAYLAEWGFRLRGEPQDAPQLITFITGNQRYSMHKAQHQLNWQPHISLAEGIARCVPYLQVQGLLS